MNRDNAAVSGSENGDEPAYVSAHGLVDAPSAKISTLSISLQISILIDTL